MNNDLLYFELPVWWLIPGLLVAAGIVFYLYSKKPAPWSLKTAVVMGLLRFFGILLIVLLLVNPFINKQSTRRVPAVVPVIVDNSTSIRQNNDSSTIMLQVDRLFELLASKGYDPKLFSLHGREDTIRFNESTTNLVRALNTTYRLLEGENHEATFLLSDGINNRGLSPAYFNSIKPIYTIGLGDTSTVFDVGIAEVRHNDVVYEGNKFPVQVLVQKTGPSPVDAKVAITRNGRIIKSEALVLTENVTLDFLLDANESGLKKYNVTIETDTDDENTENNQFTFFTDVIEGKERILITAPAPHPDIRAIRLALDKNKNYEAELYIPGISDADFSKPFDVVIEHSADSRRFPAYQAKGEPAIWYIISGTTIPPKIAQETGVQISRLSGGSNRDNVRPSYNTLFTQFSLDAERITRYAEYPSIEVPYGEYTVTGPVQVLLFQKIGSVTTKRPLLSFYDDGSRNSGLLIGTGIWKWRLQESATEGDAKNFDEMISKSVQLLTARKDKRLFRATPVKKVYYYGETVDFKVETYNEIFERMGGVEVDLRLTGPDSTILNYSYTTDVNRNSFVLGILDEGLYSFTANAAPGGKLRSEKGEFLIKKVQVEQFVSQANHKILRELASNSNGAFLPEASVNELGAFVDAIELQGKIETSQSFTPLVRIVWILVIIIILFSAEWFLRKYLGSY